MKLKKIKVAAATLLFCALMSGQSFAQSAQAVQMSATVSFPVQSTAEFGDGAPSQAAYALTDQNQSTKIRFSANGEITLEAAQPVASLYLIWDVYPESGWSLTTESTAPQTQNSGFFQEFVPLSAPTEGILTLSVPQGAVLCDIYAFSQGDLPDFVHQWQPPVEKADILLLPTHADDEHLYFGGIMPTYAADPNLAVQVAYMVNHATEPYRQQELLNGLWAVGIRNYPVIPQFPDYYSDSLAHAKTIYNADEILRYQQDLMERFSPQVVVGHDLNGEYGHGAHRLNAETLTKIVAGAGTKPQKLYLHLYPENALILDYDTPIEAFSGKTAFEMAVLGFEKHVSQQTYFKVLQNGPYDCRKFGLFYSQVGSDTKNDLMENIIPYKLQSFQQSQPPIMENPPAAQKQDYLPEATSDNLFAFLASPLEKAVGAVGVGLLLAATLLSPFVRYRKRKRK